MASNIIYFNDLNAAFTEKYTRFAAGTVYSNSLCPDADQKDMLLSSKCNTVDS